MNKSPRYKTLLVLTTALLCAFALPKPGNAQITLTPTITNLGGGLTLYQYTVSNTSLFDFSAISISVIASPLAVQSLMAPIGFNAFFDPGLGEVDFVENTMNFGANTTISGFSFTSPFAPQLSTFTALRLDGMGNPVTVTGTVLAPAIPEPTTIGFLGTGLAALALIMIRRRKTAKSC